MDAALFELGEYRPDLEQEPELIAQARAEAIAEMLEDVEQDIDRYGGEIIHAVIREIEPTIHIAPGDENSPAPLAVRQWRVNFGNLYTEVGFFGYETSGEPFLVSSDMEFDEDDEEAQDDEAAIIAVLRSLQPFALAITEREDGYKWQYLEDEGKGDTLLEAIEEGLNHAMNTLLFMTPPSIDPPAKQ